MLEFGEELCGKRKNWVSDDRGNEGKRWDKNEDKFQGIKDEVTDGGTFNTSSYFNCVKW